jgi:tetratricopeptide (TPR) repeat protein
MQEDKIKLYEELLAADPGSRLFLPLARLYLERGETDKAISTLESGLGRYQEHFEARLLLHETLREQGRVEEAREQLYMVSAVLRKYPTFWEHWAETLEAEGQPDAAAALRFLAPHFQGRVPSWADVLRRGLKNFSEEESPGVAPASPDPEPEPEEASPGCSGSAGAAIQEGEEERDPYRTKTMADILVSQGDYAQALDIYTELQAAATSSRDREKLQERIDQVKEQLEATSGNSVEPEEAGSGDETELIHNLERLAERLEHRG